jgi:hypothetical protein
MVNRLEDIFPVCCGFSMKIQALKEYGDGFL